ncbi:proteasomal ubiquitin receptor ADRM1-like [Limulus polyphemus]|uniref:Proteasomal ubiquitin receptor ADRM1-like n=1 Tax=Limulus polyphemus TaxID=6850 RepID=A0ABM1B4M9_LIMPO|nr:proteasomal ubiquitin receptor ADRM1-like [Limulus polyphemus]
MARPLLFGNSGTSQGQSKYLVEFKAGKMTLKGNMVHPDKRKGLVYVYQADDSLMHFCWKDRSSGIIHDDLIIFPDDVEFKKVQQCNTGRVFVLKFKSSSRKYFYWMQEPKTDKDDEYCDKVNEYLNHPPAPGTSRSGLSGSSSFQGLHSELSNLGDGDLHNLLNNISQQQLLQLLGGVGGVSGVANLSSLLGVNRLSGSQSTTTTLPASSHSTRTPATENTTASTPTRTTPAATTTANSSITSSAETQQQASQIQIQDVQSILSGLSVPASEDGGLSKSADSSSALTAETLQPLLSNKEFMDRACELLPTPGDSGSSSLRDNLKMTAQSPQFQQALGIFSAALQSGQLCPLMEQFDMNSDVIDAAKSGDMEVFVRLLQNVHGKGASGAEETSNGTVKGDKDKEKDSDEEMGLD